MEYFDLYDDNRLPLNKIIERGQPLPTGENRQVVHICIFNSKNQMLIQQRSATKKSRPNLWDISLGGCSRSGETSRQSAARELFEELGIKYDFSNQRPHLTINFENGFDDIYLIKKDIDLSEITFQDGEVQEVKWATLDEIQQLMAEQKFIQYVPKFIDSLFELKLSTTFRLSRFR